MSVVRHYLFVMWDGGGAVPPILGAAAKLISAGCQVSVLGENSMKPEVEAAGCQFLPYQFAPNRPDRSPESDPFPDWKGDSPFKVLKRLLYEYAADYAKDVLAVCHARPIDKVVIDGFLLGGMIGAEAAGKNFIVIWPAIDPVPHPGRPPDGLGLAPGKNVFYKLRNRALNWIFLKILQSGRRKLNAVNKNYHLPALSHPFELYDKAEKVLLLSSQSFDYPTRLPANTFYAGPVVEDPSWAPKVTTPLKEPFVMVSLGSTFQNQRALYEKLMEALHRLQIPAIITLGNVFEPETFKSYPDIHLYKAAAHRELLPQCGLVIHHGGHGIVMKSILAGLPQLVIPLGRDQLGNAGRIVFHGLGLRAGRNATEHELQRKIRYLLSEESFGRKALEMGRKINQEIESDAVLKHLL